MGGTRQGRSGVRVACCREDLGGASCDVVGLVWGGWRCFGSIRMCCSQLKL